MERWSASTGASTPRPERSRSPSRGTTFCSLWTRLQEKVEEILANTIETLESEDTGGGAVVVESVKTGEILAMASYPTYDLSQIYSNTALFNEARDNPLRPFTNRAAQEFTIPVPPSSRWWPSPRWRRD